jgi:Flp pilus assembly protein TadD
VRASLRALAAPAVAALVAIAVHLPALRHPFVYDDIHLGDATPLRSLAGLGALLTSSTRPLTALTVALDRLVGGGGPLAFRVTSILLHAVAAALVVAVARALMPPARRHAPLAAGLLFASHPLTVEAVGYASARADLLVGVGLLAAMLAFLRLRRTNGSRGALVGCLAAIAFAGASKETGAAVPLVLFVADRALPSDDDASDAARRRRLLGFHLPMLLLLVGAAVWRISRHLTLEGGHAPDGAHFLSIANAVATYLRLALVPVGLSVYHADGAGPIATAVAIALTAALAAIVVGATRLPGWLRLGAAWFLLPLLPTALVKLGEAVAEHRAYAALPGVLLVIVAVSATAARTLPSTARAALVAIPLLASVALTIARHRVWDSPLALWADATSKAPSAWDPWYALGDAQRAAGDCASAIRSYDTAIALRPDRDTRAHQNRAICRVTLGDFAGAEADFAIVRARRPADATAAFNLAVVVERRGRVEEARALYDAALALDPKHAGARRGHDRLAAAREPSPPP